MRWSIANEACSAVRVGYLTNRFYVAVRPFSNRSQMTSKCGKNISDTLGYASWVTYLLFHILTHLWSITEQMHGNMESICLYIITKAFFISKYFNITRKPCFAPSSPTFEKANKKASWRNLWSIQNEAVSLVTMRSKELWLVEKNHATQT